VSFPRGDRIWSPCSVRTTLAWNADLPAL